MFSWNVESIGQKEIYSLLSWQDLELRKAVFSLFGHSDKHKLISEAVLQFLHDTEFSAHFDLWRAVMRPNPTRRRRKKSQTGGGVIAKCPSIVRIVV